MKLNLGYLEEKNLWEEKGYILPSFDPKELKEKTLSAPKWLHFGAGNIFRSFPAMLLQTVLNDGAEDTGLIVVEGFDEEIIDKIYRPADNLSILVTLNSDGSVEKRIIGSVVSSLVMSREREEDYGEIRRIITAPTLQMLSLTITEKGYIITDVQGEYTETTKKDFELGPEGCASYMAQLTALVYQRYLAGELPLALVSMDNFSRNGQRLKTSVTTFAEEWKKRGLVEPGFVDYLEDESKISFPWSMIDKITPRPDPGVEELLKKDGVEDADVLVTKKNTYIANFVNAEKPEYLVIEDTFPAGRPALEKAGVIFTTRDVVNQVERMKVCTCLNPLHTALAIFGCLLGYTKISDEMENPLLKNLVTKLGYKEALPVVTDPGIINPEKFIGEVLNERIPNPFMPDTPQRIATDTSQKIPIRFGETIKAYRDDAKMDMESLTLVPLVLAGWLRYLLGVQDDGKTFDVSPDPMYPELKEKLKGISIGSGMEDEETNAAVKELLQNEKIFGLDITETSLKDKVLRMLEEMLEGPGAVKNTLMKYVEE